MKHRYLYTVLVLLLGFVLSEPLLRLADPVGLQYFRRSKLVHTYNPEYTISLRPNSSEYLKHFSGSWQGQFSVNSFGMRDLEEPQKNRPKIICMGDSLAMGHGVGDAKNFCHLLKAEAKSAQVLNAAVDGLGTYGYAVRTEEIIDQLDSVTTLLLFPTPTDWWIPSRFRERGILPDDEKDSKRETDPLYRNLFELQFKATELSYSLQAVKLSQEQLKLRAAVFKQEVGQFFANRSFEPINYLKRAFLRPERKLKNCGTTTISKSFICPEPIPKEIQCSNEAPKVEPLPQFTQQNLNRLIQYTQARNIRLVLVLLPMQDEEIRCYSHGLHHANEAYAIQAKQFFTNKKIDVIDLMPFTKSMCGIQTNGVETLIQDYYLAEDGHLTELGNRWAANSIATELRRLKIIEAEK
ncbi:MAG: hypothetical protein H3C43_03540 [Leptonema sp. (in: Bacteria)]|nr:hypothetical protein [Leptonema sp. (in: bacteria)]